MQPLLKHSLEVMFFTIVRLFYKVFQDKIYASNNMLLNGLLVFFRY